MKIVRDASSLNIKSGVVKNVIVLDNKEWIFLKTLFRNKELYGWRYRTKNPTPQDRLDELDVLND